MSIRPWIDAEVREALGLPTTAGDRSYAGVSTDTRVIRPGYLFVALRGERFDGHEFLHEAAERGATGAVVDHDPAEAPEGMTLYRVEDTLAGLADLARYRRARLAATIVGVAGSNGKTSTKELVRSALSPSFRTCATEGNLNNQIGLPLTLLRTPDDAEMLVLEMGTNRPGEIEILTQIARPDVAVITSIGEEHLELLGDLEGVLEEELAVLGGLAADGLAFVAEDPEALPARARQRLGSARVRVAGLREEADLRPDGGHDGIEVEFDGTTRWSWSGVPLHLPLPGRFNVRNALLALGVATHLGVPAGEAARGIEAVRLPGLRGQWERIGGLRVLADCYNSNPPSLYAAVDLLASLPAEGAKVVVLGTMREMGEQTERLHREAAERVVARVGEGVDRIVATGEFVPAFEPHRTTLGDALVLSEDPVEAYRSTRSGLSGNETVLLKASRGEALERWLDLLRGDFDGGAE